MATITTAPALKTVLSIDGGGIRGVIPARVLREIEQRMDRPVSSSSTSSQARAPAASWRSG